MYVSEVWRKYFYFLIIFLRWFPGLWFQKKAGFQNPNKLWCSFSVSEIWRIVRLSNCVILSNFKVCMYVFSQDTFQDYQEMFIQFGYVVLFSSAFPLAAMCALINNIIEIRSDAFKLCTGLQRPFGMRVESIGQWQVSMA